MAEPFVISMKLVGDATSGVAAGRQQQVSLDQLNATIAGGSIPAAQRHAAALGTEAAAHRTAETAAELHSAALARSAAVMRQASANRTNLIFQLNDIGVSLASGMNPLMVAIQQGRQIATIYGPAQGGLGAALRETGNIAVGLATKFWPVLAVVALGAALFAGLTYEINKTAETQVSFGDVFMASMELAAESIGSILGPAISQIGTWLAQMWDFIAPFLKNGLNSTIGVFVFAFDAVKIYWSTLPAALGDIAISTANNVIKAIEDMLNSSLKLLNDFTREANKFLPDFLQIGEVGDVKFKPLANPFAGSASAQTAALGDAASAAFGTDYMGQAGAAISTRAQQIANRPSDKEAKAAREEAERQAEAYRDITRSAGQFIDQQELARATLGMSTEAASRYRHEQELLNKAANDNIKLTPQQRAELAGLAASMAEAEEQTRQLTEIYDFGKDVFNSFFSDIKSDLQDGMSAWDAFANAGANALDKIADKALGMAADGIFDMIFGAVFGGLTGGLGGGLGSGFFNPGNFSIGGMASYASGTSFHPGGLARVHGEEIIELPRGTRVHTAQSSASMGAGGGTIVQFIDQRSSGTIKREEATGPNGEKIVRAIIRDEVRQASRRGAVGF